MQPLIFDHYAISKFLIINASHTHSLSHSLFLCVSEQNSWESRKWRYGRKSNNNNSSPIIKTIYTFIYVYLFADSDFNGQNWEREKTHIFQAAKAKAAAITAAPFVVILRLPSLFTDGLTCMRFLMPRWKHSFTHSHMEERHIGMLICVWLHSKNRCDIRLKNRSVL